MNGFYNIANDYPNPDALQEFRVNQRDYEAAAGRGDNQITAVMRSGTNEFHGTVFEFLRNTNLDARPFFAAQRIVFKRNQYGTSLGGPMAKDKAFFFVSYQGMKGRGTPGESRFQTLTMAERMGDFTATPFPIQDPDNPGTTFPNNIIPPDRIRPYAQKFISDFLPAPNSGPDFFSFTPGYTADQNQLVTKVDYALSDNDQLSFRYFLDDVPQRGSGVSAFLDSSWLADLPTRNQNWYSNRWSFSIQQALGNGSVTEADYVGSSSQHLFTSSEVNPAVYVPGQSTLANTQERRLYAYMGMINSEHDGINANYNSLQISFRRRYSQGVSVLASYTWSKTLGIYGSYGEGSNGQRDPFNRRLDYSRTDADVTQNFVTSFIWELPFGKRAQSSVVRNVRGGWELNGINTLRTGFPFTVRTGLDNSLAGIALDTPDQVGDPVLSGGRSRAEQIEKWFNTDAFVPNAIGTVGTTGMNTLTGPGFWNFDLGVVKTFKLAESKEFEFRSIFYNLFNHPSLGNPASTLVAPTFGRITYTASAPRVIEFAVRFTV